MVTVSVVVLVVAAVERWATGRTRASPAGTVTPRAVGRVLAAGAVGLLLLTFFAVLILMMGWLAL